VNLDFIMQAMMNDPEAAQAAAEMMAAQAEIYEILWSILLPVIGVGLLLGLITLIATWKIFKKAGTGGWKALIPIYNEYSLIKISWKKKYFWWMIVLSFASGIVGGLMPTFSEYAEILMVIEWLLCIPAIVIALKAEFKLAKAFGKGGGFAVGMILLPWIFYPILGFGKAKFRRRKRRRKVAPVEEV